LKNHLFSEAFFKEGSTLCFDKPLHWTSFDLVNKVRWLIRKRYDIKKIKVGHAGTLDPLATGLVIICTGKSTKTIPGLMGQKKTYTGEITLGATTPSYDLETEIDNTYPIQHITKNTVEEATKRFTGSILQKPPVFSALKKDGVRLYEYARKGEKIDIPSRAVFIEKFVITAFNLPKLNFEVVCSKGTYIRSLAHDFGMALNSGAHLSALRRTAIGAYKIDDALTIESFENLLK
jgi:tRNA pseudouridine55 synthase